MSSTSFENWRNLESQESESDDNEIVESTFFGNKQSCIVITDSSNDETDDDISDCDLVFQGRNKKKFFNISDESDLENNNDCDDCSNSLTDRQRDKSRTIVNNSNSNIRPTAENNNNSETSTTTNETENKNDCSVFNDLDGLDNSADTIDNSSLKKANIEEEINASLKVSNDSFNKRESCSSAQTDKIASITNSINDISISKDLPKKDVTESSRHQLLAEKLKIDNEIRMLNQSIKNKKLSLGSVNLNVLPDKGLKLIKSLDKDTKGLDTLTDQLNQINSKLESMPTIKNSSNSNENSFKILETLPSVKVKEMKGNIFQNYCTEQSLNVQTLQNLHSSLNAYPSEDAITSDPPGLKIPLMTHQKQALSWLLWRENENPSGGILADDMGLGKTLTMLSLILKKYEDGDDGSVAVKHKYKGNTLIVCPASLIGHWETEIRRRLEHDVQDYSVHHGIRREKKPRRLSRYNIVITSYAIVRNECEKNLKNETGVTEPLYSIYWNRIILDEAHNIRNYKSKTSEAVFNLKAKHRWALTGTPIHNKTEDFFALVKFLKCKPFDDIAVWKRWVEANETGPTRLNLLTKCLMLRRTKAVLISSGKLDSLPEKSLENIIINLDKDEFALYEKVSNFSKSLLAQLLYQKFEKEQLLSNGITINKQKKKIFEGITDNQLANYPEISKLYNKVTTMSNVKTHDILVLLLRLRQICCHPSLIKSMIEKESFVHDGIQDEDGSDIDLLEQMSALTVDDGLNNNQDKSEKKFFDPNNPMFKLDWPSSKVKAIIHLLKDKLLKTNDKIIIVSQWTSMLDVIYEFLKKIKHVKCDHLTGKIPVDQRMKIVNNFNDESSELKILLLSLTAGGTGLNLVGANHLILTDLHWNPQLELQASDRIYRVGQNKPVKIYKFICAETIEQRIQKLQQEKLTLADGILSGEKHMQLTKLTLNDLKMLFNIH